VRAPGLQQGDPSAEIIDLLDEESDAFSVRAPTPGTGEDGRWRRWLAPMGGVAAVGMIAYAIASSSSTHSPTAATATSALITAPASTAPRSTPPLPTSADLHYYAADPQGYILQGANVASGLGTDDGSESYQRWTATGESSPNDAWFSIETYPSRGANPTNTINAYRVELNGRYIAVSYPASRTIAADFSASPTLGVHLLGVGLSDDQMLRLAGAVVADGSNAVLDDPGIYAGFERATTVSPWFAMFRTPLVQADYGDMRRGQWFALAVGRIDPGFDGGVQLSDRSSALRHSLVNTTSFMLDGHVAVAGERVDSDDMAVVTWMVGNDVITLNGSVPKSELMDIARTVHQVTVTDWQQMIREASQNVSLASASSPIVHEGVFGQVATGRYGNGDTWFIQAAWATRGDESYVSWLWPGPDDANTTMLPTSDTPQLTDQLDAGHTYVFAALPRTYGTGATLHIKRADLEPIAVPFTDIGSEFDRTLAAYAFTEPGIFSAWIEATDGSILAAWPP
jgi:hypothetical protein